MPPVRAPLLITLLVLAAAYGCAGNSVKSDGQWADGVARSGAFSRVLVLGISPETNPRCAFEESMVQALQDVGIAAASGCSVMGLHEPLTRESVEKGAAAFGADAVLASRPLDSSVSVKEGGTIETRGDAYYKATDYGYATDYWGVYGVPVVYGEFQTAPAEFYLQGSARLVSALYRVADAERVYTLQTQAERLESREQAMLVITTDIATRLQRDGVIR